MCTLRDVVVFVAGAEFFHTLSHVVLHYLVVFPMQIPLHAQVFELTAGLNTMGIVINGVITVLLIIWAMRLSKKMEQPV